MGYGRVIRLSSHIPLHDERGDLLPFPPTALLGFPLATPPNDAMTAIPIVNYRQRASLAVNSIFGFLVVLSIILRIVARKIVHRPLDASDYCACVGAAAATGMTIISVLAVSRGGLAYGTPPEIAMAFGPGTLEDLFKLMIPAQCLWVTSLTFSKLSVLLLYLNLFSHRSMVWISKGLMVFIAMWGLTSLIVGFAFCDPFEAQWKTVRICFLFVGRAWGL